MRKQINAENISESGMGEYYTVVENFLLEFVTTFAETMGASKDPKRDEAMAEKLATKLGSKILTMVSDEIKKALADGMK